MSTMSSSLLEFILDLLSNDDELQKFEADSQKYVADAGFAGCAAEVEDGMKVLAGARPATMTKQADEKKDDYGKKDDYDRKHDDKDYGRDKDYGDKDDGHDGGSVTNNYSTTNNNGDYYDIKASDDGQVALNGGINVGDDVEGNLEYKPEGSFNENGSGVQINGENAYVSGDLNSAGGSGSTVNTGSIAGDTTLKIEDIDVNAVIGDNNDTQQQSDDAEQENEGGLVIDNPGLDLGRTEIIQVPDFIE